MLPQEGKSAVQRKADRDEALANLLMRCSKGDREALRALFEIEGARLFAVCRRILRRSDLAEEALQEGMLRIWTHAGTFGSEGGSARGWIYAVMRNQSLNMLRRTDREISLDEPDTLAEAISIDNSEAAVAALDRSSRLRVCLESLDADKRRCVLLAHLYGYTHGEIAGRLAIPLGTAKSWVRRGLSALRECLS